MAIQWSDNCYHHDDFACSGGITSTPRPGNTACRAPGVLVSIPLHEAVLEAVAEKLGKHAEEVREINLYKAGQRTPAVCGGQVLGADGFNWTVPALWESAKAKWELDKRRAAIGDFNAKNRWRKRGIAMLPVKYGMSMSDYHLSATVRIFAEDGSVHVVHGGVELGQGIHTKVAQAVAHALGCPLDALTVGDTSTLESPNSNVTGGSGTSESSVRAALVAANELSRRLEPFRKGAGAEAEAGVRAGGADDDSAAAANSGNSGVDGFGGVDGWKSAVAAAADAGISLHAAGWEQLPKDAAKPFGYATQGVGCVEVELDALTGEIAILRADVLMDQGTPLNPLIDLGQVEGGFIMALGYYLTEEVLWSKENKQINLGTWQYKPPAVHDIPIAMHVEFLAKTPNPSPVNVFGSKASAEPPMALGAAAFFAARHAIRAVRADCGVNSPFELAAPLTVERVQRACLVTPDAFTLK